MLKPEQVPMAAVRAVTKLEHWSSFFGESDIQLIVAAALNGWPGIKLENLCGWVMDGPDLPYVEETASIILPLPPQEASDE